LKNKSQLAKAGFVAPLKRLELLLSAPEADALSTELQGRAQEFYHEIKTPRACCVGIDRKIDISGNPVYTRHLNIYSSVMTMPTPDPASIIDEQTAAHVAELFRAFSDTSRVRILSALAECELNVGTMAGMIGISESAISHHLRGLRQMGLVKARRQGKEVYYRIDDDHIVALFREGVKHIQHG
jgi:DNA-binding transcriptional ArsR family regulator